MDGAYREVIALMVRVTPMARRDHPNQVYYCLKVSSRMKGHMMLGVRRIVSPSIASGVKSRSTGPL